MAETPQSHREWLIAVLCAVGVGFMAGLFYYDRFLLPSLHCASVSSAWWM